MPGASGRAERATGRQALSPSAGKPVQSAAVRPGGTRSPVGFRLPLLPPARAPPTRWTSPVPNSTPGSKSPRSPSGITPTTSRTGDGRCDVTERLHHRVSTVTERRGPSWPCGPFRHVARREHLLLRAPGPDPARRGRKAREQRRTAAGGPVNSSRTRSPWSARALDGAAADVLAAREGPGPGQMHARLRRGQADAGLPSRDATVRERLNGR